MEKDEEKEISVYKFAIKNEIKRLKISDDMDIFDESVKEMIREEVKSRIQLHADKLKQLPKRPEMLDEIEAVLNNYDLLFEEVYTEFLENDGTQIALNRVKKSSREFMQRIREFKEQIPPEQYKKDYYRNNTHNEIVGDDEWQK